MRNATLLIVLIVAAVCSLILGRYNVDIGALLGHGDPQMVSFWRDIAFDLRLPRIVLAALIGASLASSGLLFQSTLHNPLASPFTLGSSAGAALGAFVAFVLFGAGQNGLFMLFAFGFALAVSLPIYVLAARRRIPPEAVLLTGVAISFGAGAVIAGLTYIATESTIFAYSRWSLGDLGEIGYGGVVWVVIPVVLPVLFCWGMRHRLDAMAGGEELATARGVNVTGLRAGAILSVTMAVGAGVALCGPITFIGLLVPHMARSIVGSTHAKLALATPLLGALILVLCDFAARNLLAVDIPIGVMTAGLGTPAFIALLALRLRRRGRS